MNDPKLSIGYFDFDGNLLNFSENASQELPPKEYACAQFVYDFSIPNVNGKQTKVVFDRQFCYDYHKFKEGFLKEGKFVNLRDFDSLDNNVKEMTMAFCEQYTNSKSYKK